MTTPLYSSRRAAIAARKSCSVGHVENLIGCDGISKTIL
jgi:hypothetical protein